MFKITVIGSLVMDQVIKLKKFPKEGDTLFGDEINYYLGGKGANQAYALTRLGANTEMIGMVGDDNFGKAFIETFKKAGTKVSNIMISSKVGTSIASILSNYQAENKIVVMHGANFEFNEKELKKVESVLKNSDLVITQLELKPEIEEAIIKLCAKYKVPVQLNPAPAYKLSKDVLSKVTYITPNDLELSILTGMKTDTLDNAKKAVKKLLSMGPKNVISTLGGNGAMIGDKNGVRHIPVFKVKVVDTVGAGDAFNGGFAYAISKGHNIDEAVRFANAVGGLAVTKQGAFPSMPNLKLVIDLIKSQTKK
jgi:ribokinase